MIRSSLTGTPAVLALLAVLWGPAAWTATRQANADAAIIAAELALQRGECASASRDYVAAAGSRSDAKLAARATDVALDCGQFALAVEAAARWHALEPREAAPLLNSVRAEIGRAQPAEARRWLLEWLNGKPGPDEDAVAGGIQVVAGTAGNDLSFAMLRELKHPRMNGAPVQLVMGELAADAFDYAQSLKYAQTAAQAGAPANSVRALRVRAYAGLGNATQALGEARTLAKDDAEQALAEVEALLGLGREDEAEALLQQKREDPRYNLLATRRLALLAFSRAEYADAEKYFSALLRDQSTVALGVYYLAIIAERRGDVDDAMKGYELLARSGLDDGARRRVAGLYLRDGERAQAIRLLSAADDASPRDRIGAELAIAELLAHGGNPKDAVTRLDAALLGAPNHPDLLYQRAVYLERVDAGAAIEALEAMHRLRPADTTVTNALGFTLADHDRDLPRAEQLIRTVLRTSPDNPAVLDSMGWVLHKRGKNAEALPHLQRAWRAFHDGDIGAHCGEVLWSLGRKDEARAQWKAALAADPDSAALKATAQRYAPELSAPVPQPRVSAVSGTAT
jgi:tetratricopeptide (TPR) repeat protein